jgi:hypothetical protein
MAQFFVRITPPKQWPGKMMLGPLVVLAKVLMLILIAGFGELNRKRIVISFTRQEPPAWHRSLG